MVPVEATYGDLEQIKADRMSDPAPLRVVFEPSKAVPAQRRLTMPTSPSTDATDPKSPPTPIPGPATPPEETVMTTRDPDLQAFLSSLTYAKDVRKPPDNRRRGQFHGGWNRETIAEKRLAAELSWHNLGYRAGKSFGPKSRHEIDAFFDRFAAIYDHKRDMGDRA